MQLMRAQSHVGITVRDLDAYEAAMDAALDDPEPEAEAG